MTYDVFEIVDYDYGGVEIARAVSARVASELSGIPVALMEDQVAECGETGVLHGGSGQQLMVRRAGWRRPSEQ
jgi:hypothetical protein